MLTFSIASMSLTKRLVFVFTAIKSILSNNQNKKYNICISFFAI